MLKAMARPVQLLGGVGFHNFLALATGAVINFEMAFLPYKEHDESHHCYSNLMTLLRVALIGDPNYVPHKRHFGEKPLAQPFCWQCGRIL